MCFLWYPCERIYFQKSTRTVPPDHSLVYSSFSLAYLDKRVIYDLVSKLDLIWNAINSTLDSQKKTIATLACMVPRQGCAPNIIWNTNLYGRRRDNHLLVCVVSRGLWFGNS